MKQFKNQPVNSDLHPFIQTRTYFIFMKLSQPNDCCILICNLERAAANRTMTLYVIVSVLLYCNISFIKNQLDERTVGGPIKTCCGSTQHYPGLLGGIQHALGTRSGPYCDSIWSRTNHSTVEV